MIKKHSRLNKQFSLWISVNLILLAGAVIFIFLSASILINSYQDEQELEFKQSIARRAAALQESLAIPLYNFDTDTVSHLLKSAVRYNRIDFVYLVDENSDLYFGFTGTEGIPIALPREPYSALGTRLNLIRTESIVRFDDEPIGTLILYFPQSELTDQVNQYSRRAVVRLLRIVILVLILLEFMIGLYLFLKDKLDFEKKKLSESEKKFRTYIEKSPLAIFIIDSRGTITFCNDAAVRLSGYSGKELRARRLDELTGQNELDRLEVLLNGSEVIQKEISLIRSDRSLSSVILDAVRIPGNNYLCYCTNISERKRMEEQLRQSEKLNAIGMLAGGIAHDFNNMLGGILGYTELLSLKVRNDEVLESYIESIINTVGRARELTSQLLAFARKRKMELAVVDLHEVIRDSLNLLSHSINKNIRSSAGLDAGSCLIMGDRAQLQNAFLNLGLNARDAMPGGGELLFCTRNIRFSEKIIALKNTRIQPGDYIQLDVTDNGSGMSRDVLSRIFDPFFTTKEQGKGTGMGLSAVYGTVQSHNGAIDVYSEPGHGTTFKLYFPLTDKTVQPPEPEIEPVVSRGGLIMLVEDEPALRDIGRDILNEIGYEAVAFENGERAVNYYRTNWESVRMVITDMVMPGLSGRQTLQELKKINPGVKALLATGFSLNGDTQSMIDAGFMGIIQKPYRIHELASLISEVLTREA